MEKLPRARLLDHHGGRHLVSEPHLRIQVLPVPLRAGDGAPLFDRYHGELLIHCLQGACVVRTNDQSSQLAEGDQVLLLNGEAFRIERAEGSEGVVQLVWSPGNNPCRPCWESNSRFFAPGGPSAERTQ